MFQRLTEIPTSSVMKYKAQRQIKRVYSGMFYSDDDMRERHLEVLRKTAANGRKTQSSKF